MRVTPKSTASTAVDPAHAGASKSGAVSFLDLLFGAADSASGAGISDSKPQGRSGGHSGSHDSDEADKATADATQTALISGMVPVVPLPIPVNAQAAGQTGGQTISEGTPNTTEPTAAAGGSTTANNAGVLASTTQIAPSFLSDSGTVPASSFATIAAQAAGGSAQVGEQIPASYGFDQIAADAKAQAPAEQPSQPAQAHSSVALPSRAANAGAAQAMLGPLPLEPLQTAPEVASQSANPNSTDAAPGNQAATQPVAGSTSALPLNLGAIATNLNALPLSFSNGMASGNAESANSISNSSRGSGSQANFGANTTSSDSKSSAATKTDQATQAAAPTGSSHGAENSGQQNQNPQADVSQSAMAAAKTAGTIPSHLVQSQLVAKPGDTASSGAAAQATDSGTHHAADSGALVSEPLSAAASAGAPGVNAARVIQSMSGTEMRVGINSSDFGEISIHTTLSSLQLQTQISVNHNELGSAIATHIPAIQAKLGSEHGIQASIEVSQTGSSLSGNPGQSSSQRNQKAFVPATASSSDPAPADPGYSGLRAPPAAIEGSRLDIRA